MASSEAVIQVHSEVPTTHSGSGSGGHRVALVASQNNPNKVSIIPCSSSAQLPVPVLSSGGCGSKVEQPEVDENCINEANKPLPNSKTGNGTVVRRKSSAISLKASSLASRYVTIFFSQNWVKCFTYVSGKSVI